MTNATAVSDGKPEAMTNHQQMQRALGWNIGLTVSAVAVQIGLTMLLGRLLTAFDYGVFAFANAVMVLSQHLSQRGLSAALLRRREIHPEDIGDAYMACVTIFTLMAAAILGAGWVLHAFGGNQYAEQANIMMFLLLALAIQMASTPQVVILQRRFAVVRANVFQSMGLLIGNGLVGGVCAWHGLGAWSLAYGAVTASLVTGGCSLVSGWTPVKFRWDRAAYRTFLIDAATMSWLRALDVAWLQLPLGFFGLYGTSTAYSGIYQRMQFFADILLQMTVWRVGTVFYTAMSVNRRTEVVGHDVRRNVFQVLATLTLPIVAFTWTAAVPMIGVLLGDQWVSGAWTFRLLMVAFGLSTINLGATWSMEISRQFRPRIVAATTAVVTEAILLILIPIDAIHWYAVPAVLSMSITSAVVYRSAGERLASVPHLLWLLRGGFLLSVITVLGSCAGLEVAAWLGFTAALPVLLLQGGFAVLICLPFVPLALLLVGMEPLLDTLACKLPPLRGLTALSRHIARAGGS